MASGRARSLRRKQTKPEAFLWSKLRDRRFHGLKFRRQVPIDQYVADFCCFDKRLIIELDGQAHFLRKKKDAQREAHLCEEWFHILRFSNSQVMNSSGWVLSKIASYLGISEIGVPSPSTGEGRVRVSGNLLHV
ncbi:MAG: DUF559 domain-containing protein [Patescibacteria group bacterium]